MDDRDGPARPDVPAPALLAIGLWMACFGLVALVLAGMGFTITSSPLHDAIGRWDMSVTRWFADHATPTWDSITRWGSDLGMTAVVLGLAAILVVALWIFHRRRDAGFIVAALSLEA